MFFNSVFSGLSHSPIVLDAVFEGFPMYEDAYLQVEWIPGLAVTTSSRDNLRPSLGLMSKPR
jgi:hypothetical protein